MLVWLPAAGAMAAAFATSSIGLVLTCAGLGAVVATWLLLLGGVGGNARRLREAERALAEIEAASAGQSPGSSPVPATVGRVAAVRQAVVARLDGMRREYENLRAIFDAAAGPVMATNAAGDVVAANKAAELFFDRRRGVVGANIEELFTQAEVLGLHAAAAGGTSGQKRVRVQRAEGVKVYQVLAAPVRLKNDGAGRTGDDAGQGGVAISLRDITELATAVQLKTDFVGNASHELRTPLSSIRAAVETLSEGAWEDPSMRGRLMQMIAGNVTRLEDLVRDLLDLSRLETPDAPVNIEPVAASAVAATLREVFERVCGERSITLEFELSPRLERMQTDGRLLTLILKNLIDNSTKFAYERTAVRITGEVLEAADRNGRIGARFRVIDSGVGIPLGNQQRIFERFYQVDQSRAGGVQRRGTGLGLAIVKHAVKTLGGTIGVESVWKEGTTMTLELPGCVVVPGAGG